MIKFKIIKLSCWFMLTLSLMTAKSAFAQLKKMAFEKYGVAEGLPEEYVSDVVQDDQGFIWAGTQNGLVKYDGYTFHVYKKSNNENSNALGFSSINGGLIKAKDGKIWMGAYSQRRELASFNPATGQFKTYQQISKIKSSHSVTRLLLEDQNGNIWFNLMESDSSMLGRFHPGSGKYYYYSNEVSYRRNKKGSLAEVNKSIFMLEKKGLVLSWNRNKDIFELLDLNLIAPHLSKNKDTIHFLVAAGQNQLLLVSHKSLFVFDVTTQKVIQTYHDQFTRSGKSAIDSISGAVMDKNGHIWVTHRHGSITKIDPRTSEIISFKSGNGIPVFPNQSSNIKDVQVAETFQDGIWFQIRRVSNSDHYLFYSYLTGKFDLFDSKFNLHTNPDIMDGGFRFFKDKTGLLWIYTRPNLYKQTPKKHQMEWYRHNSKIPHSLPNDTISVLFEDSKQRLWIGTNNGLALYQPATENFKIFQYNSSLASSLSNNGIITIVEDPLGKIWIGTSNGLNQWQESSGSFKRYLYDAKNPKFVLSLYADHQKRLWVGILNSGALALDPVTGKTIPGYSIEENRSKGLLSKIVIDFFHDSKGNMWLGDPTDTEFGLFKLGQNEKKYKHYMPKSDDTSSLSSQEIHFVVEDSKKNLWIGTDDGLNLYDHKTDKFKIIDLAGATNWSVSAFGEDRKGRVWVATYAGTGLRQVNPVDRSFKSYGEPEGLLHNDLAYRDKKIAIDDYGKFWLPNQRGLSVFDPEKGTFSSYFKEDGFQEYSRRFDILKTKNGDIWIGGESGLNHIVPGQLLKKDTSLASVIITAMAINGEVYNNPDGEIFDKPVAYTREIELKYSQKDLRFDFVALHFLRSEDNLYSWKLENYDQDWTKPSTTRTVNYTNLSSGKYIFKVKASNADGVWNETPTILTITLLPPWWRTWWAYLGYFFGFSGTVIGFAFWRAESLRKKNALLEQKVAQRTNELAQKTSDLQSSLNELKTTQTQLIQSEKMASLGELTAGIAHEIQNPLNFVNNFSELNSELIVELKNELALGNQAEAINLANDIDENEKKILHHGRRADSIVKSMLQHSRTSTGIKEPTDINALADEYFQLAYHGLRAKDKSFNAAMVKEYDEKLSADNAGNGKIKIVSQDIGRVVLNLITNAFYEVNRKSKQGLENYQPTVTVKTQKIQASPEEGLAEGAMIFVIDNGGGISRKVMDKIFQPFFSTKPSGEGTGLGLSLAYDIIHAHGGKLSVESKEHEGATFKIYLPKS